MNTAITHWGYTPSGESIYLFRLTNASGASIELTNLGASWVSAHMPDKHGIFENILLGYDNAEGYIKDTYYMGATVGRFANRIHQASFSIKDTTYQLEKNDGENTNHGGAPVFTRRYGNGSKLIPVSASFSTLRIWKEDIRAMYT